jgi:hypothetical protein
MVYGPLKLETVVVRRVDVCSHLMENVFDWVNLLLLDIPSLS